MNTLKYGLAAILGTYLISTQGGTPVMAATLTGTIKVDISHGEFAGIYTGDFTYDDTHLTKVGSEFININGTDGSLPGLLSLNFRFLDFATGLTPVTYTAKGDFAFPNGPSLRLDNGIPIQLSFLVDPGNNGGIFGPNEGLGFVDSKSFLFGLRNGTTGGQGQVSLELDKPTPVEPPAVPESSSPLVSLLAALGLGAGYFW